MVLHMFLSQQQVTVEVRRMGGGFGGKSQPIIAAAAALAAHITGPRKISYASGQRHGGHGQAP